MQMQRLLRLKYAKNPVAKPCSRRVRSPSGAGSTRITSAPRSASTTPQDGPITVWLNSSTVRSASGRIAMAQASSIRSNSDSPDGGTVRPAAAALSSRIASLARKASRSARLSHSVTT